MRIERVGWRNDVWSMITLIAHTTEIAGCALAQDLGGRSPAQTVILGGKARVTGRLR